MDGYSYLWAVTYRPKARWASGVAASQSPKAIQVFYAPVHQSEYIDLELPALEALGTKFRSANRGSPNAGRTVSQTNNDALLTEWKRKSKPD